MGHDKHVTELDCGKRLLMLFLSPHSRPSCQDKHARDEVTGLAEKTQPIPHATHSVTLYTNTMASVWAIASLEESGEKAMEGTMYGVVPWGKGNNHTQGKGKSGVKTKA